MKTIKILNLGAGVQSTTIALMMHHGLIPKPDAAIFADTQEEEAATYDHLRWLIKEVKTSFPVLIRTAGKLGDNLDVGSQYKEGHTQIPAFVNGKKGIGVVRRQCTSDYKIDVIEKTIRRELANIPKHCRWPEELKVVQVFGMSYEEIGRAQRVAAQLANRYPDGLSVAEFPLIPIQFTRRKCLEWLKTYCPHTVPRSSCMFCPYKTDSEWLRLKTSNSESWNRAVHIDTLLRNGYLKESYGMINPMFLHRSCKPLEEIDFSTPDSRGDQYQLNFAGECAGMCGV